MKNARKPRDDKRAAPNVVPPAVPVPKIDVKKLDPVRNPLASTTEQDIARADDEGMAPVHPHAPVLP